MKNSDLYRKALIEYCRQHEDCEDCKLRHDSYGNEFCDTRSFYTATDEELERLGDIINLVIHDMPESESTEEDVVNRPSHYTQGGIECIEAIKASMTPEEYKGFLKGQVIKYIWRYRLKGKPAEDLKKAQFYLIRLIDEIDEGTTND